MNADRTNPWSTLLESIRRRRSSDARFFKPVCLIAVVDGVLEGEIEPSRINPDFAIQRFRRYIVDAYPGRADLGWRPFWHLSNDGAWHFTRKGRRVEPADFGLARKPDSRRQLLNQIDHVAVAEDALHLWQKPENLTRLREALLEMLEEDDQDCRAIAAVLRSNPPFGVGEAYAWETDEIAEVNGLRPRGQGFQISSEARIAIERRAMTVAEELLRNEGWKVEDVSATQCFDFLCLREGEVASVEVKGTTGDGDQIILTRAEVEYAKRNRESMVLIVVSGISIVWDSVGNVFAHGGTSVIHRCWSPLDTELQPISYVCRLVPRETG
jgi:hypothetical protein